MITPEAAKVAREDAAKELWGKLQPHIDTHATALGQKIDAHLIRSGMAHVSDNDIQTELKTGQIISEYSSMVKDLRDTFIRKILGKVETDYRTAGWHTIIKKGNDKYRWEIVIKEKEVDVTTDQS